MNQQVASVFPSKPIIPDFSGVEDFKDIQMQFVAAARSIMLEHKLVYEAKCWCITALELYLKLSNKRNIWWDCTTHAADEQLKRGTWYVHYKPGTQRFNCDPWRAAAYCGIDITAGCEKSEIYAGLLVRELDCVDGSALALQNVVRGEYTRSTWTPEEKETLKKLHASSIHSGPLRLVSTPATGSVALWIGPRIFSSKRSNPPKEPMYRYCCLRVATSRTKKHVCRMKPVPPGCW